MCCVNVSDRDAYFEQLRALLARQATLAAAEAALGVPKSTLHDWAAAAQLPRRRRRSISAQQERKIGRRLSRDESLRVIARHAEVSKSTVHRRKQTRLRRLLGPGPRQVAWYRCPRGHKTNLVPCVTCQALDAAAKGAPEKGQGGERS
jgi:hypothetical protein